jgi:hypothetical protein
MKGSRLKCTGYKIQVRAIYAVDNLNTVRREASRYFRNKKKAHMRAKIKELESISKTKKY